MPTIVSYLESNAFQAKDNGAPGEGQVLNIVTTTWEEPDTEEKEQLQGYQRGETAAPRITEDQRAIRLGRALDGNTMVRGGGIAGCRGFRDHTREPTYSQPVS